MKMRIDFDNNQLEFIRETLTEVDSRAFDPVYKNTVERVKVSKVEERSGETKQIVDKVVLEEFEVYTIIEALQERAEYRETNKDNKKKCEDLIAYIDQTTGLSL